MTLTPTEQRRPQWWVRLRTRAEKDPASVLADERWTRPELCRDFFDLCNDVALQRPADAPTTPGRRSSWRPGPATGI